VVANERVRRIKIVKQLYNRSVIFAQVFVINASLNVRALKDCNDYIIAVFTNRTVEQPVFLVGAFVNKNVFRLWRTDLVEVELLKVIRSLERIAFWFIVTGIEESAAIACPRGV